MFPKVCLITPFPPMEDGVAEYSQNLATVLQEKGARISVITQKLANKSVDDKAPSAQPKIEVLKIWRPNSVINQLGIFKQILMIQPDIVHLQYGPFSGYGGILGEPLLLLILLLRIANFPCIVTLHSIWMPREAETRAYERSKDRTISKIASIYYYSFIKSFLKLFNYVLFCVNFNNSTISEQMVQIFHLEPSKAQQIVHGSVFIQNQTQELNARKKFLAKEKVLLCSGFLRTDKGYEYAIEALRLLKEKGLNVKLIIAGKPITLADEKYLSTLKEQVAKLSLQNAVIFDIRYIPEKELYKYFACSSVLLLPYSLRVGPSGPLSLAASFGLPVVMTIDGKFALRDIASFVRFVPPRNSVALSAAIEGIIRDRKTTEQMSHDAILFSMTNSIEQVAQTHLSIYLRMINNATTSL